MILPTERNARSIVMTFRVSKFSRATVTGLVMLAPLILASCRVTSQGVARSQTQPNHDRLEIIYRAHPATGPMFTSIPPLVSQSGIMQAAAEAPLDGIPFENLSWSKAELRIEFPHPDGRQDWAQVTLHCRPVECGRDCQRLGWAREIEQQIDQRQSRRATFRERWFYEPAASAPEGETVYVMSLPKRELDVIIDELNSHGFFAERGRSTDAESELEVRLNRRWTSKCWGYEPQLDALTTRVYEEGEVRTVATGLDPQAVTRAGFLTRRPPHGHSE